MMMGKKDVFHFDLASIPPSLPPLLLSDIVGVVTLSNTTSKILSGTAKPSDPVTKVIYRQFEKVNTTASIQVESRPSVI